MCLKSLKFVNDNGTKIYVVFKEVIIKKFGVGRGARFGIHQNKTIIIWGK